MGLGNHLFQKQKKKGLSQEEVAGKLGVSRQTISKWETDETLPDIRQSKRLAVMYGLSLDELIEFSSTRQNTAEKAQKDFYINEAVAYIQQNCGRELTIDEVASFCKLNRNYFSRKFKKVMGCSP